MTWVSPTKMNLDSTILLPRYNLCSPFIRLPIKLTRAAGRPLESSSDLVGRRLFRAGKDTRIYRIERKQEILSPFPDLALWNSFIHRVLPILLYPVQNIACLSPQSPPQTLFFQTKSYKSIYLSYPYPLYDDRRSLRYRYYRNGF